MESGKITQSEALDLFDVSRSTLRKDRRSGAIDAEQEPDGRKAWLYVLQDLEARYIRRGSDPVTEPGRDPVDNPVISEAPNPVSNPVTDAADIEARVYLEYVERDLEQRTAERDRARSDHEHEKGERERLDREVVKLRAELDAAVTIASDRAKTIDELKAEATERTEKLDEYAQNLTRRYRRTTRRAEKASRASDDDQ